MISVFSKALCKIREFVSSLPKGYETGTDMFWKVRLEVYVKGSGM